jgi:hypothetical protein
MRMKVPPWKRVVFGTVLLTGLVCLFSASLPLRASAQAHHFINLSLWYPISTNQNPENSANFRLSLIYGRLGTVKGLDLNLIAALLHQDMKGLQVNGIYSEVRGELQGIQFTGGVNFVHGDAAGIQVGLLTSFDKGHFSGLQYSSLFNYVGTGLSGAQLSAVLNLADGDGSFLQVSSVANVSGGKFTGLQAGTFFNYTYDRLVGVQIGGGNFAETLSGVQVGIGNFAAEANGLQIGVLNQVAVQNGIPIGLVNTARGMDVDWVTFANSLSPINTGIRMTVRRFYSILSAGGHDLQKGHTETGFLSWNYGYAFPVSGAFSIDADLGFTHIFPQDQKSQFALQARLLGELRLSRKVAIFAGGGVVTRFSEYSSEATSETDPLGVAGISLF